MGFYLSNLTSTLGIILEALITVYAARKQTTCAVETGGSPKGG